MGLLLLEDFTPHTEDLALNPISPDSDVSMKHSCSSPAEIRKAGLDMAAASRDALMAS